MLSFFDTFKKSIMHLANLPNSRLRTKQAGINCKMAFHYGVIFSQMSPFESFKSGPVGHCVEKDVIEKRY